MLAILTRVDVTESQTFLAWLTPDGFDAQRWQLVRILSTRNLPPNEQLRAYTVCWNMLTNMGIPSFTREQNLWSHVVGRTKPCHGVSIPWGARTVAMNGVHFSAKSHQLSVHIRAFSIRCREPQTSFKFYRIFSWHGPWSVVKRSEALAARQLAARSLWKKSPGLAIWTQASQRSRVNQWSKEPWLTSFHHFLGIPWVFPAKMNLW